MLTSDEDSVLLAVRVKPRARRTAIGGERAGRLLVEVTAPPLEGRANEAVRRLIATTLQIAPRQVTIARGESGRDKLLRIHGVSATELARRLSAGPMR